MMGSCRIVSFAIIDFDFVWNDVLLSLTLLGRDRQLAGLNRYYVRGLFAGATKG